MKTILSFVLLSMYLFEGCQTMAVQVIGIECANCTKNDPYLSTENDTIKISYYFWDENGVMGVAIKNKNSKPITSVNCCDFELL